MAAWMAVRSVEKRVARMVERLGIRSVVKKGSQMVEH
jgi:hypothetical protein